MPLLQPASGLRYGFRADALILSRRSRFFYCRQGTLLSFICLQSFFAEAESFWCYFDEFVVGNEFDGLLEVQRFERDEADCFVCG